MKSQERKDRVVSYVVQAQMSGEFDTDILHRKCFNVNMRLFWSSPYYKDLIMDVVKYMDELADREFVDYGKLQGISGANLGIPFNIIGVRMTEKAMSALGLPPRFPNESALFFMINPEISEKSDSTFVVKSNCGSIRLREKISVRRHSWVKVEYYDVNGIKRTTKLEGPISATVQHEIEHNLGILITDKEEKGNEKNVS